METKTKEIAEAILKLVQDAESIEVDSCDCNVEGVGIPNAGPGTPLAYRFNLQKWHEVKIPGKQGPGSHQPLGQEIFTVTIERKYIPLDDEEG